MKRALKDFFRTNFIKALLRRFGLSGLILAAATASAAAQKKYDTGVTDTEIKIGNIMPYSGPASAYGIIGKTMSAYMRMINDNGGVNGRKINFISYDDAYSPPKTVEQARKLVESDEVFLIFAPLGTAPNAAIQKYMNTMKVPQLFVATGASRWGDPEHFPWTIGWQPNYRAEARIYATYILQHHPNAKIGVLYQNDDFGKDYVLGLKDVLRDKYDKMVVASVPYEISMPTVDSQVVAIKTANPDIFINIGTPKFAAQAIKKVAELGWHPIHIMTNVSASVGAVLKPAGLDNCQGHPQRRLPDGRHRSAMGQPSRHAEIPRLHGQVLSGGRQVRERAADRLQHLDRAGRGAEALRRQSHARERHEGGRESGFRDQHLYPGNPHQDLADGFLSDRAGADDEIHRRELAVVRPDHRRARGVGVGTHCREMLSSCEERTGPPSAGPMINARDEAIRPCARAAHGWRCELLLDRRYDDPSHDARDPS